MRLIPITVAALVAFGLSVGPAYSQDWGLHIFPEEGFSSNFPGEPKIEEFTWASEYRQTYPAKRYTAADFMGTYSTVVVDYRDAITKHRAMVEECRSYEGRDGYDGDACQYDGGVEIIGAVNYASSQIMRREGIELTHFMWYFTEMVGGNLIQLTNPDDSRTFAAVHMHDGRLYVWEATVKPDMPDPVVFMQNLGFVTEEGQSIRYATYYTEGYGEWEYPRPKPERRIRPLDDSLAY